MERTLNINLKNGKFKENKAGYGGVIYVNGAWFTFIDNCIFTQNFASYSGGAVFFEMVYMGNITNSVFNNNIA